MGIESVHVGLGHSFRVGVRVELESDESNDMGCDVVVAWIDDVDFGLLHLGDDNSARAQLLALMSVFSGAYKTCSEKLAEIDGMAPSAETP